MPDGKLRDVEKILNYWYTIEFLNQDSYETSTNEKELTEKLDQYKNPKSGERTGKKTITVFQKLNPQDNIKAVISGQASDCQMTEWGNLTFYVGKVERQKCIESLADALGFTLEQVEKNRNDIALLSFQCDSQGKYIEHSLSLSTIVWALSKVSERNKTNVSDILSEREYANDLDFLEHKYFIDESSDAEQQQNQTEQSNSNVEGSSITTDKIVCIFKDVRKIYEKYLRSDKSQNDELKKAEFQDIIGIKYQLFKNEKIKEKYNEDDYMGLNHDFYSSDIKLVMNKIKERPYDFQSGMLSDLVSYVYAPYNGIDIEKKHDLVRPKDEDILFDEMLEILNVRNAPMAKWPSRYMPALMQQVAVNFAVSDRRRGIFRENGCIFSVNGPPGTGKTTLLKEIVASNIVEKAYLLSQYKKPDDAFRLVRFKKGNYHGSYVSPVNGGDSYPYSGWYEFIDDRIADYGILVTSNNNTAVENISKELPLENGILNSLNVTNGDSDQMRQQLESIRKLYSTKNPENGKNDREVYFTKYARNLFGSDGKGETAWGLVAAPLGKKSNINSFYKKVLGPLYEENWKSKRRVYRLKSYQKANDEFVAQWKKVEDLKNNLANLGDVVALAKAKRGTYNKVKKKNYDRINEIPVRLNQIIAKIGEVQILKKKVSLDLEEEKNKCAEYKKLKSAHKGKYEELSGKIRHYKKEADKVRSSICIFTKVFRKRKYRAVLEQAQSYMNQAELCEKEAKEQEEAYKNADELTVSSDSKKTSLSAKLKRIQADLVSLVDQKENIEKEEGRLLSEIKKAEQEAKKAKIWMEKVLRNDSLSGELRLFKPLDEKFIEDLLSEGEKSTAAQTANPWMTEEFNREREKLLYLALQMTREFVLNSEACSQNFITLEQYWGFWTKGGKKIKFHPQDKEDMMGSLLNTLFLLTPVISSTFASVGSMLRDVKKPGVIGTLIIDEAGQAQPQMAVGALYRSRRCIIVGDPKQVEPVVTDDMDLLKKAYSGRVYENYKDKSLSVQKCADLINPFGTFLENESNIPEWVGCPLLVHRRCISPMYDISNDISYNGIMKQQTLPPSEEKQKMFLYAKSQWFDIGGKEMGNKNHFVEKQGIKICDMVNDAFMKSLNPNLFIISPFKSVVTEMQDYLMSYQRDNMESALAECKSSEEWLKTHIGTVHTFQGKEANEVIFVLGCDESIMGGYAVRGFVNSNIVNVAVTRAKYRLYVVGNASVWDNNQYVKKMKNIMDNYNELDCACK